MIQLPSFKVSRNTLQELKRRTFLIQIKGNFAACSQYAKTAWESRTSSKAGKEAFKEITDKLLRLSRNHGICHYCEQNTSTDIEHVFPKRWFPLKTFDPKNYLSACGDCNTHNKKDLFAIFIPEGSKTKVVVSEKPENEDACIVNPRIENPMDYFWLDIRTGQFIIHPNIATFSTSRVYQKAEYTCNTLLRLNGRNDTLINARKHAIKDYSNLLKQYIRVKISENFEELDEAIDPLDIPDKSVDFNSEKEAYLGAIKNTIITHSHPTVWFELIRQRKNYSKLQALFQQAPEALTW